MTALLWESGQCNEAKRTEEWIGGHSPNLTQPQHMMSSEAPTTQTKQNTKLGSVMRMFLLSCIASTIKVEQYEWSEVAVQVEVVPHTPGDRK
ncbi:hypothetical protein Y032_0004g2017 [Ancylostoma ceylanicum]|uniref:Uncharacterized protein n=1 Tax=Ancylostoma ceylanicum TaxID=53326 RepID=A0A016VUD1_9BILA|nr:hypothetical protein Y032_0004g2017 [Ancylostoma ceylanicum]